MDSAVRFILPILVALLVTPAKAQNDVWIAGVTLTEEIPYFGGLAHGLLAANRLSIELNGAPLFCLPPGYALTGSEVRRLASMRIGGGQPPEAIALAFVVSLATEFAC
ncbi:MAG: hypothetical protein WEB63_07245 [Cucumibacter sp.]